MIPSVPQSASGPERSSTFGRCRRTSAFRVRGGSAAAAPAFSGPRSRGTGLAAGQPRTPRQPGVQPAWSPRMGPAPAGATATLRDTLGRPTKNTTHTTRRRSELRRPPGPHRAGGSGLRAQAPFAVTMPGGCLAGEERAVRGQPGRCPASVGRRTQGRATRRARRSGRECSTGVSHRFLRGRRHATRKTASGRYRSPATRRQMRRGSRQARWSN
jgi:hypothetical protein